MARVVTCTWARAKATARAHVLGNVWAEVIVKVKLSTAVDRYSFGGTSAYRLDEDRITFSKVVCRGPLKGSSSTRPHVEDGAYAWGGPAYAWGGDPAVLDPM